MPLQESWVAEQAADVVWRRIEGRDVTGGWDLLYGTDPNRYLPPEEVAKRIRQIVGRAKTALDLFVKSSSPSEGMQLQLAQHAIRLARLDPVVRARRLEPDFEAEVDGGDAKDLVEMLRLVPFDQLLSDQIMLLNPTLGEAENIVSGADADLISGDMLTDIKVSTKGEITVPYLDQMLGYLLLARRQRQIDGVFPDIRRIGIYLARHAYLWVCDVAAWMEHPAFAEIEEWFFKRADEVFVRARPPATD